MFHAGRKSQNIQSCIHTCMLETVLKGCSNMTFTAHMKSIYMGLDLLDFYKNTALLLFPEAVCDFIKRMFCGCSRGEHSQGSI